jgi:hypothetical protein
MPAGKTYGYQHRKERAEAIKAMPEGELCWRCNRPMSKTMARFLDYDHMNSVALGGADGPKRLTHRSCNRSAGATLGNKMRGIKKKDKGTSLDTRVSTRRRKLPEW